MRSLGLLFLGLSAAYAGLALRWKFDDFCHVNHWAGDIYAFNLVLPLRYLAALFIAWAVARQLKDKRPAVAASGVGMAVLTASLAYDAYDYAAGSYDYESKARICRIMATQGEEL